MNIQGKITFDEQSGLYAVSLALLGLWTQGKDMDEGFFMAGDGLKILYPEISFDLYWSDKPNGIFYASSTNREIVPIVLKEARLASGLSLLDAAKKLGYSNQNSIYAYERGEREPSVSKFQEMLGIYGISLDMQNRAA